MLKPGLGKGLDDLMHGDQVAGKNGSSPEAPPPATTFGRGMKTLIQPEAAVEEVEGAPESAAKLEKTLLPSWFYFAADILLLAFTIAITLDAERPFDAGTVIFCVISVMVGAVLAVIGVVQVARERGRSGGESKTELG